MSAAVAAARRTGTATRVAARAARRRRTQQLSGCRMGPLRATAGPRNGATRRRRARPAESGAAVAAASNAGTATRVAARAARRRRTLRLQGHRMRPLPASAGPRSGATRCPRARPADAVTGVAAATAALLRVGGGKARCRARQRHRCMQLLQGRRLEPPLPAARGWDGGNDRQTASPAGPKADLRRETRFRGNAASTGRATWQAAVSVHAEHDASFGAH